MMKKLILMAGILTCMFSVTTHAFFGPNTQMAICLSKHPVEFCQKAAGKAIAGYNAACDGLDYGSCGCMGSFPKTAGPCN